MKKQRIHIKKLALDKSIVRHLNLPDLGAIHAGLPITTSMLHNCTSQRTCDC
jgi:hypothetical protein